MYVGLVRTYLVCAEQLMKENPSSMVMKLMLLILDLKLKSTTIASISVSGHYTITDHYVTFVRTIQPIVKLLIYGTRQNKVYVT